MVWTRDVWKLADILYVARYFDDITLYNVERIMINSRRGNTILLLPWSEHAPSNLSICFVDIRSLRNSYLCIALAQRAVIMYLDG